MTSVFFNYSILLGGTYGFAIVRSFLPCLVFVVLKRVDVVVGHADDDCVPIIMIFMAF